MNAPFKKILVTGAEGFLGHHIVPELRRAFPGAELAMPARAQYDLLAPGVPTRMFQDIRPDCVVHLAARSGGILDNRQHPADYFHPDLSMNAAALHAALELERTLAWFLGARQRGSIPS